MSGRNGYHFKGERGRESMGVYLPKMIKMDLVVKPKATEKKKGFEALENYF